jgi:hypothetical protein
MATGNPKKVEAEVAVWLELREFMIQPRLGFYQLVVFVSLQAGG